MSGAGGTVAESMRQVDALMAFHNFEKTEAMKALDAAILAGRTTVAGAAQFLVLHSRIVAARSVLASIGAEDERYGTIHARCEEQIQTLRAMAVDMDGAVRVAFGL